MLLIHIDLSIFQNNSEKGAPKFIFKKIVQCRQVILYLSFLVLFWGEDTKLNMETKDNELLLINYIKISKLFMIPDDVIPWQKTS